MKKVKKASNVAAERIRRAVQNRFNPIRNLTPEILARQLENFQVGNLRDASLTWEAMENRDPLLKNVAMKRKKSVARNGWEILMVDDSQEAQSHKAALEYFYNNVTATHVLKQDQRGGLNLILRQMMDAVGKEYAVHEIVWKPQDARVVSAEGEPQSGLDSFMSAEFRFVPLWFFEARQGKLRYLPQEAVVDGEEMLPNEWMVTVGDGIMEACSVAYMFKHLPLKDWLNFSEKFGMPGLLGKTDAAIGSEEWEALKTAVESFGSDWAAVCNRAAEIGTVEIKTAGDLPYPQLVELMERSVASLWRGADLATISKGEGTGASLQEDEGDLLLEDDLVLCEDALNEQASKPCIFYLFGTRRCLAYLKLKRPIQEDIPQDIAVDEFLIRNGAPVAVQDALERYGRQMPEEGEPLLAAPKPSPMPGEAANAGELPPYVSINRLAAAFAEDLTPLRDRLARILEIEDVDLLRAKLNAFLAQLPRLLKDINADPESARVLEDNLQTGLLAGVRAGAKERKGAM